MAVKKESPVCPFCGAKIECLTFKLYYPKFLDVSKEGLFLRTGRPEGAYCCPKCEEKIASFEAEALDFLSK